ncbi:Splicing factor U2af small subunit A [Nosema granulosis]|uniref:Splicing factor U2af small subunit A n=1 Tax=Nosema granulosis TaxID=83296 RepID=A0A9P6KYN1_9MICR|nr:Splicing factor U2af small subunit A [Nosema granulosis]
MVKPICSFFSKTNACKHGDDCIKSHSIRHTSPCIVLKSLYLFPDVDLKSTLDNFEKILHTEIFFEDIFTEISLGYGQISQLFIAANSCRHIAGNVYIQFKDVECANNAIAGLSKRTYYYTEIKVERGAMIDISEAVCGDYLKGFCTKKGECSYVHPINISKRLLVDLYQSQYMLYSQTKKIRH